LQQQARQDAQNRVAAVFVAVLPTATQVLGYFSLSASSINAADLPPDMIKTLPRYPLLPVTLLRQLAIDQPCKGKALASFY